MKGENGVPETPDWSIHPYVYPYVIRVSRRDFAWLMDDDDEPRVPPNIVLGDE